jgi:AcrR family transcriptional regulator
MKQKGPRRQPLVEAMVRVAGSKGYRATSVADVVAEARASRATFYKYFGDKEDCFLAAFDLAAGRAIATARSACEGEMAGDGRGEDAWVERARAGLSAIIELFASEPASARTVVVEVIGAGPEARRRHNATIDRLARLLAGPARSQPGARLSPNTARMAVGAVAGLLFDELRDGGAADPAALLPELEFALLVPFLGPRAAGEASRRATVA